MQTRAIAHIKPVNVRHLACGRSRICLQPLLYWRQYTRAKRAWILLVRQFAWRALGRRTQRFQRTLVHALVRWRRIAKQKLQAYPHCCLQHTH